MGSLAGGRVGDHEGEAVRLRELSHGTDHAKGAQIHEVMAGEHALWVQQMEGLVHTTPFTDDRLPHQQQAGEQEAKASKEEKVASDVEEDQATKIRSHREVL